MDDALAELARTGDREAAADLAKPPPPPPPSAELPAGAVVAVAGGSTPLGARVMRSIGAAGWTATDASSREGASALSAGHIFGAIGSFCLIFGGSVLVGAIGGAAIALLFKLVNLRQLQPAVAAPAELIVLVCLSYATFLTAEYARLSGIVSSLFSGAVCVVYVRRNLTPEGAELCKTVVKTLAKLCDTIIFVLMGLGFWLYTIGGQAPSTLAPNATRGSLFGGSGAHGGGGELSGGGGAFADPCVALDEAERKPMEPSFIMLTLALTRCASCCLTTLHCRHCESSWPSSHVHPSSLRR